MDRDQRCLGFMEISEGAAICPHYGWRRDSAATWPLYMPPGTVLRDQYLVGRALGQAGSGFTYLAWDQTLARKVELKEFFPKGIATRLPGAVTAPRTGQKQIFLQSLEEFRQEDPEVVAAENSFRANGSGYLVMQSLKESRMRRHPRRSNRLV